MIDLKLDDVSKRYRLRRSAAGGGVGHTRGQSGDFWAVRHVSFEVQRGESLGIVGPNGAGKSTMLKLLSRITAPTEGEITIDGRLAALIEIGSGFHPELSGRENVYLNGSILGMRRREIAAKLDSIIDFSGVGEFIDTPVKWYSSGMHVRLGFSIAAHLDPDILVVDEILAVGDVAFQAKCFQRISQLRQAGTTLVLISHDATIVERLCDRALLMRRGELVASGSPTTVMQEYQRVAAGVSSSEALPQANPGSDKPVVIAGVTLHHPEGGEGRHFRTGWPLITRVHYTARQPLADAVFEVFYFSQDGSVVRCEQTTGLTGERIDLSPGRGTVEFNSVELPLLTGIYNIGAALKERDSANYLDWWYGGTSGLLLHVQPGKAVRGDFYMTHDWRLRQETDSSFDEGAMPSVERFIASR